MKKKFKGALSLLLCMIMVFGAVAVGGDGIELPSISDIFGTKATAATSGTCGDNLTWSFDESTGTLEISGTGNMANYSWANRPWEDSEDLITTVTIGNGVTSIGDYAFYDFDILAKVSIPYGVTKIGNSAFELCRELSEINLPNSLTAIGSSAFKFCHSLTNVTIPDSVKGISNSAFESCTGLTSLTIPNSVTNIGDFAFWNCTGLTSLTISNSVTNIGDSAFRNCTGLTSLTIPNSVASIGDSAFYDCSSITNITIPDSVTEIGRDAFVSCDTLATINVASSNANYSSADGVLFNKGKTRLIQYPAGKDASTYRIPSSVSEIDTRAFYGCSKLSSITIPNGVTRIDRSTFERCTNLTEISIPQTVTSIGEQAFFKCQKLQSVNISNGTKSIENGAFWGCQELKNITIPSSVTSIGSNAFMDCFSLDTILISENITSIGSSAFNNCFKLHSIKIPSGITEIASETFKGCSNLETVDITGNIKSIGYAAFADCCKLADFAIPVGVAKIESNAFANCESLETVKIPKSVLNIGSDSFVGCSSLAKVEVDIGNPNYASVNGVLFDKEKTTILLYPYNKPDTIYNIPSSVASIDISFWYNNNLSEITVDSANTVFTSENGMLFNKDKTELLRYPAQKSELKFIVPNDVISIGTYAFYNCKHLQNVSIPSSVSELNRGCFSGCTNLVNVEMVAGLERIGIGAFIDSKISSINIPNSVTDIGNYAFAFCPELKSIYIPSSTVKIGESVFSGCSSLEKIIVDATNEKYSSDEQGVLYNKDKSIVIRVPQMLSIYYMPDSVKEIASEFSADFGVSGVSYCTGLKKFVVGEENDNFSNDSQGALYNKDKTKLIQYPCASSAETYVLPSTVFSMAYESSSFSSCPNLKRIEVEAGNTYFWNDENGILYMRTGEKSNVLAKIPDNAQIAFFNIPESTTGTVPYAFSNIHNIKRIHLSNLGCYSIESGFYNNNVLHASLLGYLFPDLVFKCDLLKALQHDDKKIICAEEYPANFEISDSFEMFGVSFELCDGNHDVHKHTPKTVTVPASCTVDGMEYEVCSECGETIGTPTVIKAKGHTEVKDIAVKPTCTATGLSEGAHCSVCNTIIKKQEVIPATGHTEVKDIAVKPTCTATGLTEGAHCSVCNTIIKKQEVIPATGHTSGDWVVVTEPTADADGKRVKKCTVCGTILSEEILPKLTVAVDEKTGIELDYSGGDYSGKVELSVEETFDGAAFNLVNTQFNVSQSFIYDFKMTVDGVETQPTGTVKVRIPLPEGFDPARTFVYHVDTETGKVVKMAATYKDGYLEFETDHFSYYAVVEEAKPCKLTINTPSTTTVSYGFTLNLHANVTDLPEGARVVWSMDGSGFELIPSADGMTCGVKSVSKGSATITAKVVDKNGNAVKDVNGNEITASQKLTSKAGFFQKLAAFFKKLFGSNMIIPYALNKLIK